MTITPLWYSDPRPDMLHPVSLWLEKGWYLFTRCDNGHEKTADHTFLGAQPPEAQVRDVALRMVCQVSGCGAHLKTAHAKQGYQVHLGPPK